MRDAARGYTQADREKDTISPAKQAASAATRHLFPGMGKYADKDECPDRKKHTPMPSGYVAWHEKAEKLRATHAQTQCPTCGFWSIWKRKRKAAA